MAALSPSGAHPSVTGNGWANYRESHVHAKYRGTQADQADRSALGRDQVLRVWTCQLPLRCTAVLTQAAAKLPVHFHRWIRLHFDRNLGGDSDVCLVCSSRCGRIILTNEAYSLLEQGLTDRGPDGLVWGFVIVAIGFLFVFLSLAEMASMYVPVLRIWVLVSNRRHRRALESSTIGYQNSRPPAARSSSATLLVRVFYGCIYFIQTDFSRLALCYGMAMCHRLHYDPCGHHIQGLIVLNNPHYVFERWHGTLLVIAITLLSILFNTFLAKRLPLVEVFILILHICGLFAIIIPLWVLAPRRTAKQVFTEFNDGGNWAAMGQQLWSDSRL